jgi:hypothetical protein
MAGDQAPITGRLCVPTDTRKKGHSVSETQLQDGSIKVTVRVGGAA